MDVRIREILEKKIVEAISEKAEVLTIADALNPLGISKMTDLATGIIIGRVYNSFLYQTRRILGRSASDQEFGEFVEIVKFRANTIADSMDQK